MILKMSIKMQMLNFNKGEKMKKILVAFVLGLVLAGCAASDIGAYTTGIFVSDEKMEQLVVNKSKKSDVETIVGHPPRKTMVGKNEIWYYDYQKIRHIGSNVNEATVFEFNPKGVLIKKYKTAGSAANPLTGK